MYPTLQHSVAGLADPWPGQPRQEQQLLCVPSLRNYARHPHAKSYLFLLSYLLALRLQQEQTAEVTRAVVGSAPRGFPPDSSATLSAAGLRSAVVPHELGHHLPHGMHHRCLLLPHHQLKLTPQLVHLIVGKSCSCADPFKDIRDSWYQISNVQSLVCS